MAVQFVLVVPFFTLTVLRYNSAGQLFCVLCNVPVKSAILWDSHVLGKKHKEVIMALRLCLFLCMFMSIMFIIVHIYTQLFTSWLDRRLIIQHANMLIALRKEHLQDTEPFLRAFRFGRSKISIQPHTLIYYAQSNSFTNSSKWIK